MLTPERSKEIVNDFLAEHFASLEHATRHQGESYQRLIRIAGDVALSGGKRLRPYMSMMTYEAYSGNSGEEVLPVAAAQEVMHIAMLVHDDIMDGDTVRHGEANVTGRVLEAYEPHIVDPLERRRRAEHTALLVGDLLVGEAYGLTDDLDHIDPRTMVRTRRLLRSAMRTVVGGQLNDAEAPFIGSEAVSPRSIAHDKTAHYTFVTPLLVGATLAEAPQTELSKLQDIGENTGIAYQLRDDILGVFGDSADTGKSNEGDLREGKRTLLTETFETTASERQRRRYAVLQEALAANPDNTSIARTMRKMLRPARAMVELEIAKTHLDVKRRVGDLAIDRAYRDALEGLAKRSLERNH